MEDYIFTWGTSTGEGIHNEAKKIIFCVVSFDTVDAVWAFETLAIVGMFHRFGDGEYLVVVNFGIHDVIDLVKEVSVFLKDS